MYKLLSKPQKMRATWSLPDSGIRREFKELAFNVTRTPSSRLQNTAVFSSSYNHNHNNSNNIQHLTSNI